MNFVNFYEKTKDAIATCDKLKPRFHAFLKIAQSKPECGRQTLVDIYFSTKPSPLITIKCSPHHGDKCVLMYYLPCFQDAKCKYKLPYEENSG